MKTVMPLLVLLLAANSAIAADRQVKCQIDNNDKTLYKGKCVFAAGTGGSFYLSHPKKDKELIENVTVVSVEIVGKGVAEVRGLTTEGVNSRWGEAKRSEKDKACWVGEDFKICAW